MTVVFVFRNVEVEGQAGLDVRIEHGRIAGIGKGLPSVPDELDGRGGALIPGLVDHHIHLIALAAQAESLALNAVTNVGDFAARIKAALATRPAGAWLRATGYHERMAGDLTRRDLDLISPGHKVRVQHQTGSLWILNSLALEAVGAEREAQSFIERDAGGALTGRIWRGDAWLRSRLPADIPPLGPLGRQLAAFGITAVTDTSATTDEAAAGFLADAVRRGDLPQRLTVMSRANLAAPDDGAFALGAVKILLDDHDLPDLEAFIAAIRAARAWRRTVAVHCVTATQLALTLAAFKTAGSVTGDRIEHGSIIPATAIPALRALRLTIVTQPGFVRERGDRYAIDVDPAEQGDLYRCRTLIEAGINLAAGSDAPYASPDPWTAIEAATTRCTKTGRVLGQDERLAPRSALALYLKEPASAASLPRTISLGARAELCLLAAPLAQMLAHPAAELVRATFAGGRLIYSRD